MAEQVEVGKAGVRYARVAHRLSVVRLQFEAPDAELTERDVVGLVVLHRRVTWWLPQRGARAGSRRGVARIGG